MSNPISTMQDQYLSLTKQGQETTAALASAWIRSLQQATIQTPVAVSQTAAHQTIDQTFDFAVTVINMQRTLSKQLISRSAPSVKTVTQPASAPASETSKKVTKTARRTLKAT